MRKFFLPVAALVASGLLFSCNSGSGGMSATAKKNLETNRAINKAFEAGEFDKMKDYIAADGVDHGGEKGDVKGVDSIISEMKRYKAMMPDSKGELIKEMADDDYVFYWSKTTGTMGGKTITMTGLDVSKFKDGKAVEHWVYMDPKDMMAMMPPMPQPTGDTMRMDDRPNK